MYDFDRTSDFTATISQRSLEIQIQTHEAFITPPINLQSKIPLQRNHHPPHAPPSSSTSLLARNNRPANASTRKPFSAPLPFTHLVGGAVVRAMSLILARMRGFGTGRGREDWRLLRSMCWLIRARAVGRLFGPGGITFVIGLFRALS